MHRATSAYTQTTVATVSPGEVVIMLFGGVVKFLTRAKAQIEAKDYAGKGISISRATDILNELDSSLNREKGGEVAENLHKLYFWALARLSLANLKLDIGMIDEVIASMEGLRDAYTQIQEMPEVKAVSEQLSLKQELAVHEQRSVPIIDNSAAPMPTGQMGARGRNLYSKMAQSA